MTSSQRTFTSSIFLNVGGSQVRSTDDQHVAFDFHIDSASKRLVRDRRSMSKGEKEKAPEFITKPRRQFVEEGQTAKFKAILDGPPSTKVIWSKNGKVITNDSKHRIFMEGDTHHLEICAVAAEDGGSYTCTLQNSTSSVTATAELEVFVKPKPQSTRKGFVSPKVDVPLTDQCVAMGDRNVQLECKFSNAIDATTTWRRNGQTLNSSFLSKQTFDGRLAKLTLNRVTERETGVYECEASSSGGSAVTTATISIADPATRHIPPKFVCPLVDQVLAVGDKLLMESKVTGYPKPTICWYKNKEEVQSSKSVRTEFDGSTARLVMSHVQASDSAIYMCVAENDAGRDQIQANIKIKAKDDSFKEPPIFTKELTDMDADEGDKVELVVEVKGTPPIDIVWLHKDREIRYDDPELQLVSEGSVHKLVITDSLVEDSGEIVCEAYNDYGDTDTFCVLTVKEKCMQQTSSVHNDCDSVKHFQQYNSERGIYDSKYGTTENLKLKPNQDVKPEYKKPDFALKPHSVTAGPGLSAIFLCRPTGEPPPTVQWIKQGEVIQKGSKYWISSDEDCILEIRKVTHEDSGQYTCMLTNAAGSVSTEATLIVMETVSQPTTPSNARSLLRKTSNQEISLDVAKTSSNSFSMGQHQSNHGNNLYPVSTDLKKGSVHNPSCSKKVTEITQKLQGTHNFNGTNNSGRVEGNRINDSPNKGLEGRLGRKYSAPLQYNTGKSRSQDSSELQPLIERLNRLQQFDHKPLKSPVQSPGVDYRQVLKSKQRSESVPRKGSFPEDGARDGVNNDIRRDKGTAKYSERLNKNSENNAFRAKISQRDLQSVGGNNRFKDDKVDVKIIQGSKVSSLRSAFTADKVENHPIKTNNKTTYKLQNDPIKFNVRNNSPSFVPKNEQIASTVSSTFTSTPPVDACNKSNRALQTKKSLHKESHESFENKLYSHSNAPKSGEILPGQSKIIPEIPANGETILSKTEQEKSFPTRNSPTVKIEFSEEEDFRAMLDKRRKNSPFLSKRSQLAEETNENEIKHSEISRQKEINTDVMRTAVTNSKSLNCKSEVGIPSQEDILALSQKTPNYCDSTNIVSSNQITESELEELLQRRKNRRKMQENYLKDANEHQNIKNCSEETTKRNVKTEEKFDSAAIVHDGQNMKENSNSEERKNSYKVNTVKTDIKNKMDTNSDHQSKVIKDCVKNEVEPDLENEDFRSILSKRKRNNSLGKLQTKDRSPVGLVQTDFRHVLTRHVESDNRQPPMFQSRAYDQKVQEGQPVTMELAVTGVPKPTITWSIHDKIIKPSKFFKMTYEDNTARLVIDGAYPEDDGVYTCTATNSVGSERCSCRLFVQELFNSQSEDDMSADTPVNKAPPVIDFTTEINEVQSHTMSGAPYVPENDFASTSDDEPPETAKLVAPCIHEINPNMVTKSKGEKVIIQASFTSDEKPTVKWYRGQEELIKGNDIFISATEHFSRLTISNIGKDDAGKYTITVTNSAGSVSSSATISVQDVPDPPIGRPYASEVNLRSVIIAWSGPAYDGGCQVTGYQVEICDAEGENWQTLAEHCHSTSYHVGNLQPLSPYFFRVCAKNKHGYSKPSEVSAVIVTKDKRPDLHLSIDSDDVFVTSPTSTCSGSLFSPFSTMSVADEELPFEPRDVVIRTDQPFEDDYDLKEEVGKGKFGKVFKCTEKTSGRTFAAKVLRCRTKREKETIHGEIAVMNQLTHPKLLMLWDAYETSKSMVLVMEYVAGGELFDRVADEDLELTERDCVHFVRQICDGVHYMHGKSILHLDLKPENILCVHKENNLVKIIDFGLARVHTEGESLKVMFGTPEFIAPEVVNYEEIGFSTDIWSLGVICYVLLSGLSPFMGDSDVETLANVTRGDFDFDDEAFEEISETAKGFIKSALQKNKKKRPAIEDCINHRWLAQSERNSCKKLRQSLRNLKQFMARRKWQKMGNAIRAVGRMSSVMQRMGKSGSGSESSINNDSEPSSQTEHIVAPSRTVSQQEVKDSAMTQNSPKSSEGSVVFKKETDVTVHDTSHKVNQGVNSEQPSNYETPSSYSRTKRKITFIKEMVDCEAFQGDIVRFDVKISCDSHVTIQWFHEDTLIEEDRQHSFVENIEECCTEASLIIKDVTLHNEGDYTCQCSSDEEEITCYGSLSVYGSGSI